MEPCQRNIEHYSTRAEVLRQDRVQAERLDIKRHNKKIQGRKKAKQNKTRAAKSKAQLRFMETHKEVKGSIISDRRN